VRVNSRVLPLLPVDFLAGGVSGLAGAGAALAGDGVLAGGVLSTERTITSGVSEAVDGAAAVRVSTVIVAAVSS
jgi:hypothetical protein